MILFLAACSGSATPEPEARHAPLQEDLGELRRAVGRAPQSDERACEAVDLALMLAPEVDAAVQKGTLDWEIAGRHAPGLVLEDDGHVRVDHKALAMAAGPTGTSVALITVGGTDATECGDPPRLSRWLSTRPGFEKAPECLREMLKDPLQDAIISATSRDCLCAVPAPDPTPALAETLEKRGLSRAAAAVSAWPTTPGWKACPSDEGAPPPTE